MNSENASTADTSSCQPPTCSVSEPYEDLDSTSSMYSASIRSFSTYTTGGSNDNNTGYTRTYHRYMSAPYNLNTYLCRQLKLPWLTFFTAMMYVHKFIAAHGTDQKYPSSLLGASAFFLACKVEGISKIKLKNIIQLGFEVNEQDNPEAFSKRSAQLLMLESLIMQTLEFNLVVISPIEKMGKIQSRMGDDSESPIGMLGSKLLAYIASTPILANASADELAYALTHLAYEATGRKEAYEKMQPCRPCDEKRKRLIIATLIEFMARGKRRVKLPVIDEQVLERDICIFKRQRPKSPFPNKQLE